MSRAAALALALLVAVCGSGCELIADIPTPTAGAPSDAMVDTRGDGASVECVDSSACTRVGAPICDLATHTCGGCVLDGECPSNVCLPDGTCADAARFVYAAAGGTGDTCTIAQPCAVDTAVTKLTATQDIVKLAPGTYARAAPLTLTIAGTIAGGGSTFAVSGTAGTVGITADAVPVHVVGLRMTVASNNAGVRCQTAGGELHLARVTISGSNAAIYSTCPLEIDRSTVTGASLYAIYANAAPVTIRNSYVVRTGAMPAYTLAAVHLQDVPSGTVEHVTIANTTAAGPSGLRCPGSGSVTIRNIIAWGNVAPGVDATCTVTSSIVDPGYTGGTGNTSVDPQFADPANGDFHLMPGSPAAGLGTAAARFAIDADGEDRPQPQGTTPDPGADEIP